MALFRQRYRIEPVRFRGWDYSAAGWYFVTICTGKQRCFFGDVMDGTMRPSRIRQIVAEEWLKTEQIRAGVQLDQWVLMPNHLHGIIVLLEGSTLPQAGETKTFLAMEPPHWGGSTKRSRLKPNSLGAIIGQFKSSCTKRIWVAENRDFSWHPRFYDHIIRDERSLNNIRAYIVNNPTKWALDKDNPENLFM